MTVKSVRDVQQLTIRVLTAEIPDDIKGALASCIDEAASKGLGEVTIQGHKVLDKNAEISVKIKTMKKLGTYLRTLGYDCVVQPDGSSLTAKWF